MKNKSLIQKISLLVLSLLCTGCLLGKTITRDLKNEADLSSGLMAWYPFNGNAVDISGNGNHGTIHGTVPAKDRNGNEGGALYFDGNSKIVVPHSDSLNPENQLTISMWIKYDEYTNVWSPILHKGGPQQPLCENREYSLWLNHSSFLLFASAGDKLQQKTYSHFTSKSKWFHYSLSLDRRKKVANVYLDGENVSTHTDSYSTFNNSIFDLQFGSTIEKKYDYTNFKGFLDSTRLYSKALNADEITLLHECESKDSSDNRDTPPPQPLTDPGTPPDPDYKDTIAELKRLLAEKDKKLAHCETERAAKEKQIGELTSTNAKLQGEVKSLNGKVTGLEQEVATLKSDNEGLKGQIQNLREDNQNISHELSVTNEHLEEAIQVAETPFINGWVYDPVRGWLFTDAEHFPLVYTHNDQSWNYYELGSSEPRYFYNYTSQDWVAWDAEPQETQQLVAANNNL